MKNSAIKIIKVDKSSDEEIAFIGKAFINVRDELKENPYILEARKVLTVKGYRSAIGNYWNAVIDDLRNKIIYRSLDLFNKEMRKNIKRYEDFQDTVTDYELIEGAYKIGVIDWEAHKILHQARETRHIFDGHPKSSEPSPIKVLDMINDCNKYVLSQECPPKIINIDEYLAIMESKNYDKNSIAVEQAFSDLPLIYKNELIHKLYTVYTNEGSSTVLRANIEFCAPILWSVLSKEDRIQIGRRFDQDIVSGNKKKIDKAMEFLISINGFGFVSNASRKAVFEPAILRLEENLDNWDKEGNIVQYLEHLGTNIPDELVGRYVSALTLTFVGHRGSSLHYARKDFYSDTAAPIIKKLFEKFDHNADIEYINTTKNNKTLKMRILYRGQLSRLRILANIILGRPGLQESVREYLEFLTDENRTEDFLKQL